MRHYSARVLSLLKNNPSFNTPERTITSLAKNLAINAAGITDMKKKLTILASYRGVMSIKYHELDELESGSLIPIGNNKYEIIVNSKHSSTRQIFTIAHEICHTFFNSHQTIKYSSFLDPCEDPFEEKLCDIGASEIIFSDQNFNEYSFSIASLDLISKKNHTSYEATAIKMIRSGHWPNTGLILWKKKLKKGQTLEQPAFWYGFEDKEVYRVEYSLFNNNIYIPQNKSINQGNYINDTENNIVTKGEIRIDLDPPYSLTVESVNLYKNVVLSLVHKISCLPYKLKKIKSKEVKASLF